MTSIFKGGTLIKWGVLRVGVIDDAAIFGECYFLRKVI